MQLRAALASLPRAALASLPTPLERGPLLPGGARLWVKRDDLTGLGLGGNKVRKLELLCGRALADGADTLVTVGAAQSNHCRMTAAAGAVLGLEVHLVLGGEEPVVATGNQLLSRLFGATLHATCTESWPALEAAKDRLCDELRARGRRPFAIPIGGSTGLGAAGYAAAFIELVDQCEQHDIAPAGIVVTSSSGGTHAGLALARAVVAHDASAMLSSGVSSASSRRKAPPEIVAVAVAPGVVDPIIPACLARSCASVLGLDVAAGIDPEDLHIEQRALGPDYAVPTDAADAAIVWAARHGGWVTDRVYTGKGMAGLLLLAEEGRWGAGDDVVFIHTGGHPALFAPDGAPQL